MDRDTTATAINPVIRLGQAERDADTPALPQPGKWTKALLRMFMKQALVLASERVAESFYLVTLESPAFKGVAWQPGQKLQIGMGSGLAARTFTPMDWDASEGVTHILGYAHGSGPAGTWLQAIREGSSCDIFGPRASLDQRKLAGPLAIFGDETSMALAHALRQQDPLRKVQCFLEVNDINSSAAVLACLGLAGTTLVPRVDSEAHLQVITQQFTALADSGSSFVLTGKAPSIQNLHRHLKRIGVAPARILNKAYWAPGRTGLD